MRVLRADEMRRLDAHMIEKNVIPGLVLMENAAQGVFSVCKQLADKEESIVHIFCGAGNNGGDGFASARILLTNGYNVKVYLVGSPESLKGDAKTNAQFFIQTKQITLIDSNDFSFNTTKHDIIIDALFGIGLSRTVEGVFKAAITAINAAPCPVVAVDLPSGLNADTGAVMGAAVKATHTVTFQYPKPAHFLQPGKSHCGEISIQNIGIDDGFVFESDMTVASRVLSPLALPKRYANTHKGTYGSLGLVVSSDDMFGAGLMCAKAAFKSGVGLLHLFVPQNKKDMFASAFPEAILHTQDDFLKSDYALTALACGPGLSKSVLAVQLVTKVLIDYQSLPKILDADALTIIAENPALIDVLNKNAVLTPHPKEFSRLSSLTPETIVNSPVSSTENIAEKLGCTILLKLATSVSCSPDGSVRLIDAGTPGMAKGGSGDVLSGIIGAFLAQGFSPLDATEIGAYISGSAGEMAAKEKGEYSMSPLDTIDMIAKAINEL